jgi:TRAP-type C4-dicarboxylate transport system substrate-binding protein
MRPASSACPEEQAEDISQKCRLNKKNIKKGGAMISIISKSTIITNVLRVLGLFAFFVMWSNPGEAADPIRMRFANHHTAQHPMTAISKQYLAELEAASKGTVVIEYHGAEALGKHSEQYDMTKEGLADISTLTTAYYPAKFQLVSIAELPFFSTSSRASYDVVRALVDKKLLATEFDDVRHLVVVMSPPNQIFSNKKITKVEDFKGMRFHCQGTVWPKAMSALGGQCVSMGITDVYLALQRGTLDAASISWASVKSYRWVEVAKYPMDLSFMGGYCSTVIMNNKSWSRLSPEVQTEWLKISEKYGQRFAAIFDGADKANKPIWAAAGKPIETLPDAEMKKLAKKLEPVWLDWINRMEKAGKPGKEVYMTYVETMKKNGQPVLMKLPGLYKD